MENAQQSRQYCTFSVADHLFGIDVQCVQEVLRKQELTHVPLAPPEIAGLLNLRGAILPAIDLKKRLGFTDDGVALNVNVIYASEEGPVDLLAEHVGDVLTLEEDTWEAAPESLKGNMKEVVLGVHKLKDKLLFVLDPAKVVSVGPQEVNQ